MKRHDFLFWYFLPCALAIMIPVHIITKTLGWLPINGLFLIMWFTIYSMEKRFTISG